MAVSAALVACGGKSSSAPASNNAAVPPGTVDPSHSALTVDTTTVAADDVSAATITVSLKDSTGKALSGKLVQFAATGFSNTLSATTAATGTDGKAQSKLSSARAETKHITAAVDGVTLGPADVDFMKGGIAPAPPGTGGTALTTSLRATPTVSFADGTPITLTFTARDASGNPLAGVTAILAQSGTGTLVQPGPTDANGQATGSISSTVTGREDVTATVNNVTVATATVAFSAVNSTGGCAAMPNGGYIVGSTQVPVADNWSSGIFTGTAGDIFVPDLSVSEHNDPNGPLTGGGHHWVFDQGSTLCKETDTGTANALSTGWSIPGNNTTDCILLPVIRNGGVVNLGDIPYQGDVITPTCNPALLSQVGAPNPTNTYFNQLGCAISHGLATDAASATSFLFVTSIHGGLFSIPLENVTNPVVGGTAGKAPGAQNYYSDIPEGSLLTNAIVSKDAKFAIATSLRRTGTNKIFACLNPLGDPGDPTLPIDPAFIVPPAGTVKCMVVGGTGLAVGLSSAFGPDNQPYFGGQRTVNSFDSQPGGKFATAWPNCLLNGVPPVGSPPASSLADAFARHLGNGCGNAVANGIFDAALVSQPQTLVSHGSYMYTAGVAAPVMQFKVTVDPATGVTKYLQRTYLTGVTGFVTGIGIAEDLQSLMVFSDPTGFGLAGKEVITRLPLCENL